MSMKGNIPVGVRCNLAGCDSNRTFSLAPGYYFCRAHYDSLLDAFAEVVPYV